MDWASLSKEKKQALVLVAMWVIGGIVALYYFVLAPYFANRTTSANELDVLAAKIEQAEVTMRGESRLHAEYALCTEEFKHAIANYIVPMDNPLSWVTEKVYANARQVGVDVQTVAEVVSSSSPYWDVAVKSERSVKPYGVRIVTECSYQQLIDLVEVLEKSNPALCVTDISISPQDATPAKHILNMTVEWPIWGRQLKIGVAETNKPPAGV
jgi:hypothetical protein